MNHLTLRTLLPIVLLALSLTGCVQSYSQPAPLYLATSQSEATLLASIQTTGSQVVTQGNRLWVIMPVENFFRPASTTLIIEKQKAVGQIAQFVWHYIKKYPKAMVRVYGYSDAGLNKLTSKQISAQYAQVIGAYLWRYGISRHRLSIVGFGKQNPIASNQSTLGHAYNRRVMIEVVNPNDK